MSDLVGNPEDRFSHVAAHYYIFDCVARAEPGFEEWVVEKSFFPLQNLSFKQELCIIIRNISSAILGWYNLPFLTAQSPISEAQHILSHRQFSG